MAKPTYTFKNGTVVTLREMPKLMLSALLEAVQNVNLEPPLAERKMGASQELRVYPDYDNKNYQAALRNAKQRALMRMMEGLIFFGVKSTVPDEQRAEYEQLARYTYQGNYTPDKVRYLWVMAQFEDEDELSRFQDAVIGLTEPTPAGEKQAEGRFQGGD